MIHNKIIPGLPKEEPPEPTTWTDEDGSQWYGPQYGILACKFDKKTNYFSKGIYIGEEWKGGFFCGNSYFGWYVVFRFKHKREDIFWHLAFDEENEYFIPFRIEAYN